MWNSAEEQKKDIGNVAKPRPVSSMDLLHWDILPHTEVLKRGARPWRAPVLWRFGVKSTSLVATLLLLWPGAGR